MSELIETSYDEAQAFKRRLEPMIVGELMRFLGENRGLRVHLFLDEQYERTDVYGSPHHAWELTSVALRVDVTLPGGTIIAVT